MLLYITLQTCNGTEADVEHNPAIHLQRNPGVLALMHCDRRLPCKKACNMHMLAIHMWHAVIQTFRQTM